MFYVLNVDKLISDFVEDNMVYYEYTGDFDDMQLVTDDTAIMDKKRILRSIWRVLEVNFKELEPCVIDERFVVMKAVNLFIDVFEGLYCLSMEHFFYDDRSLKDYLIAVK